MIKDALLLSASALALSLSLNAAHAAPGTPEVSVALPDPLSDTVLSALRGRGALFDPDELGDLPDGGGSGDDDIDAALIEVGDDNDDDEETPGNLIDLFDENDRDTDQDGRGALVEVGDDSNLEDGTVLDVLDDSLIQLFGDDLLGGGFDGLLLLGDGGLPLDGFLDSGGLGDLDGLLILGEDGPLAILGGAGL